MPRDFASVFSCAGIIDRVELLRFDVTVPRHFSFGTWHNRQHGLLRLWSGGAYGVAECMLSANRPDIDLREAGACFTALGGCSAGEALRRGHEQPVAWPGGRLEMAEIALLDLIGRLAGRPTCDLLGLQGRDPVPATPSILSDDPSAVARGATEFQRRGWRSHLKIKLFGRPDLDLQLITAARSAIPPETYLSGDVNSGYGPAGSPRPVAELAAILGRLQAAGLSGCEDPAVLEPAAWVELQRAVGALHLIPDVALRPSQAAVDAVLPGMGGRFNIHPDCTGSMLHAIRLGHRLAEQGSRLVIGDNSLIGPGCSFWQQIAIGFGAAWCEAVEKPEESDDLLRSAVRTATRVEADGTCRLVAQAPGFGTLFDERVLASAAVESCRLWG